ncbi:hypothetical protein BH24ACT5_BH24ACT5_13430 [soil metagenome]
MTDDSTFNPPPGADLIPMPKNELLGWMAGPDAAAAAISKLEESGVDPDSIYVISGDEGVRRLDPSGRQHGWRGRIVRMTQSITSNGDDLAGVAEYVRNGGVLVSVPARDDEEAATGARVLRAHGVERMRRFDALTYTDLK